MAGVIAASPRSTASSMPRSSALSRFLSRYPRAPALMAANRSSTSSLAVSITIATPGASAARRRVATSPPPPGIATSISTRSGRRRTADSTAAVPSATCPTTSWPQAPSSDATPSRNSAWSSASRMRIVSGPPDGSDTAWAASGTSTGSWPSSGTVTRTSTPPPTWFITWSVAPIRAARSRMERRPYPGMSPPTPPAGRPRPSSATETVRMPASTRAPRRTRRAEACLRTLVSASWTIR